MKLTDNFDYLYLKGLLQDKYKDKLFLPDTLVNAIENILLIAEDQENEIEKLKKPKYIMNIENGNITEIKNDFISKDKIIEKIKELEKEANNYRKEYDNTSEDYIWCLAQQRILEKLVEEK